MRKILTIIASVAILAFSGCAGASSKPTAENNPYAGKEVSTYLVGAHMDVKSVESTLKAAGFSVVATYKPVKKGTTIVFTNDALKAQGAKPGRAYAAVLRVFVDDKEKIISFTNPIYFGKAFMQDDFDYDVFAAQLASINKAFPGLKGSTDRLKFEDLAGFHFMIGYAVL